MNTNNIIFIANAWNTGSGFVVEGYDFIITSLQTIGFSKQVTIKTQYSPKQKAKVLFTDLSAGLAFIEKPTEIKNTIKISDFELTGLKQPINTYRINYHTNIIKENFEIINDDFSHNNIIHLLLNKSTKKHFCSIVFNTKNELMGITKYFDTKNEHLILPAKNILQTMEEYATINQEATRCTNCFKIVKIRDIHNYICPICTANIIPETITEILPTQTDTDKKIENALKNLNYNLQYIRIGQHIWEINKGSAKIIIRYEPKQKFIITFSILNAIKTNHDKVFKYLLNENKKLKYFSLSINKNRVFLTTPYFIEDDFNRQFAQQNLQIFFQKADYYDDIINKIQNE